jgi:hypothetical protein
VLVNGMLSPHIHTALEKMRIQGFERDDDE